MSLKLRFHPSAAGEWRRLDPQLRRQFEKKLIQVIELGGVGKRLRPTLQDCFKIKLRSSGYRLVYGLDEEKTPIVLAVGKRDESYLRAVKRHR